MNSPVTQIDPDILAQKELAPALYANVDFSIKPERFTDDPAEETEMYFDAGVTRAELLAKPDLMRIVRKYVMRGDPTCDAYASLMQEYGFRGLVDMLEKACREGVEAVENAPPQLVALIREMETKPAWLDMDKINRGAELLRNDYVHVAPYVVRGSLLGTFMNKYSALPMAMTGAFASKALGRTLETGAFFTLMTVPGAMERFGPGFRAAAKVRLMHSLVRFHALRSGRWDLATYGLPIPQIDQMPAGILDAFFAALEVKKQGRDDFTPDERAKVEVARYRSYLLGVPEELLPDTVDGIIEIMMARSATLRRKFEDETCGALVRGTMEAEMPFRNTFLGWLEPSLARLYLMNVYLHGDPKAAAEIGVQVTTADKLKGGLCLMLIYGQRRLYNLLRRTPGLKTFVERRLVAKLQKVMAMYGDGEFETDAKNYKPAKSLA